MNEEEEFNKLEALKNIPGLAFQGLQQFGEGLDWTNDQVNLRNALRMNPAHQIGSKITGKDAFSEENTPDWLDNILDYSYKDARDDISGGAGWAAEKLTGSKAVGQGTELLGQVLLPDAVDFATGGVGYLDNLGRLPGAIKKISAKDGARIVEDVFSKPRFQEAFSGAKESVYEAARKAKDTVTAPIRTVQDLATGGMFGRGGPGTGITGGGGGRYGNRKYWTNLSENNQRLFEAAGLNDDDAVFILSNWDGPVPRSLSAAIESGSFSDATYEFMKSDMLPELLEDLRGIDLSNVNLQVDHVAQLRAILPFWDHRKVKQFPKIRQILLKEGIFGGHDPRNLKYLPNDVHVIKSRFWIDQIGKDGSKFFDGRRMDTYAQVEAAAKEMKTLMNRSDDIVEKLTGQYFLLNKTIMSPAELDAVLRRVDLNYGTYNLDEVRQLLREIKSDDLKRSQEGLNELIQAVDDTAELDDYSGAVRQVIQDTDPADLPKPRRVQSKKKKIEKDLKSDKGEVDDTYQTPIDPNL